MSFVENLKEAAKAELENEIENLTQPQFFYKSDPDIDFDGQGAANFDIILKKRKLDELYDRAPLYMTSKDAQSKKILAVTPNDIQDVTSLSHDSHDPQNMPNYKGIYSEEKDSFMFRGDKQCFYFRLKDDAKRRLVKRYVKDNLNEVAQVVQEETQKIFKEGKSFFESLTKVENSIPRPEAPEVRHEPSKVPNPEAPQVRSEVPPEPKNLFQLISQIKAKYTEIDDRL